MPHILVKVHGHDAVWSPVVDAPLTPFVATVDDRRAVAPPGEDLSPERLARLERYGSSLLVSEPGEEVVALNRAGPDKSCMSIAALLHAYGDTASGAGEPVGANDKGR